MSVSHGFLLDVMNALHMYRRVDMYQLHLPEEVRMAYTTLFVCLVMHLFVSQFGLFALVGKCPTY